MSFVEPSQGIRYQLQPTAAPWGMTDLDIPLGQLTLLDALTSLSERKLNYTRSSTVRISVQSCKQAR